ncbi:unnamed protein product [Cyprideis torosa]|uniref:Lipocalin/cytosolic fatty-acid binding domain-containing protein n=1 Tax=Cyprideis torosa TaxID=163714 RepID=A0A7R8ZLW1_9CRUS|nr:unnamed protein product [Cyprideis torosa]CAG0894184.1 unnamed protein product [Cyprideis torosa]
MGSSQLQGTWKLHSSENFEDYLKATTTGYDFCAAGRSTKDHDAKAELTITEKDGEWTILMQKKGDRHELKFRIGEEFQEVNPVTGQGIQSIVTEEDGKLTQIQRGIGKNGEDATIVREIDSNGKLLVTLSVGDVTARRIYTVA